MNQFVLYSLKTRLGVFKMLLNKKGGVYRLYFPGSEPQEKFPEDILSCKRMENALNRFLEGEDVLFFYPLDLSGYTTFQIKVFWAVNSIAAGEVKTYREVAEATHSPKAWRAVGNALAANRHPLFIPCHRVVKNNGEPGGFTAGSNWKHWLLELENKMET